MNENSGTPQADEDLDQLLLFSDPATRRVFLKQMAGTGAALTLGAKLAMTPATDAAETTAHDASADTVEVRLTINGRETKLQLDPRVTLLDALRDRLGLTGSKKGCDAGQCGACTMLVNG